MSIDNGVTVWTAMLSVDQLTVTLITSPLTSGPAYSYTLTVNNVFDLATVPNAIAPDSMWTFEYVVLSSLEIGPGDVVPSLHELTWDQLEHALTFDLVRGDLQELRDGGDFVSATDLCVASGLEEASFTYSENPEPGEAWFLLLRPVTAGGNGSYDSSGLKQSSGRDLAIADSGADCP